MYLSMLTNIDNKLSLLHESTHTCAQYLTAYLLVQLLILRQRKCQLQPNDSLMDCSLITDVQAGLLYIH